MNINANDVNRFLSDHPEIAFLLLYIAAACIIFLIAFACMVITKHNEVYSVGWSAAVGVLLPILILCIIMFVCSLFKIDADEDEDGDSKSSSNVKDAAIGALGIIIYGKLLLECPPKAGAWMLRKFDPDAYLEWLIENKSKHQVVAKR